MINAESEIGTHLTNLLLPRSCVMQTMTLTTPQQVGIYYFNGKLNTEVYQGKDKEQLGNLGESQEITEDRNL